MAEDEEYSTTRRNFFSALVLGSTSLFIKCQSNYTDEPDHVHSYSKPERRPEDVLEIEEDDEDSWLEVFHI